MVFLPLPVFNFQEVLSALIEHGAVSLHKTIWKRRVKNDKRRQILSSSIRQQPQLVWSGVRRAARESNINTEAMNKEGWNMRAAECYGQRMAALMSFLTECGQRNIPQAT